MLAAVRVMLTFSYFKKSGTKSYWEAIIYL
jgi:hypothetical protein